MKSSGVNLLFCTRASSVQPGRKPCGRKRGRMQGIAGYLKALVARLRRAAGAVGQLLKTLVRQLKRPVGRGGRVGWRPMRSQRGIPDPNTLTHLPLGSMLVALEKSTLPGKHNY